MGSSLCRILCGNEQRCDSLQAVHLIRRTPASSGILAMLRGIEMNGIQQFLPCTDIETRQAMWVAVKNGEQLGVFDAVSLASSFATRYADDYKPVTFCD